METLQPLWTLRGSGVLLLRDWRRALALVHYETSLVGAYDEFAVFGLTSRGPTVTQMPVNSKASCEAGRALWGFPKTVAKLSWQKNGPRIAFRHENETFRIRACGFSFPIRARAWTMQLLDGQSVRVPCEIAGGAKLAFRGKQLALFLEEFELKVFAPQKNSNS